MALNTKAKLGYLNALAECPLTWSACDNCWELTNEVTGEIFQATTRAELAPIQRREAGYLKDGVYPNIPYGIIIA